MSSFFSDDEDSNRPSRPAAPTRGRGRAAPRLARHLRTDQPPPPVQGNVRASSSTVPSSPGHGASFFRSEGGSSDVTGVEGFGSKRGVFDIGARLFGEEGFDVGDVPSEDLRAALPLPDNDPEEDDDEPTNDLQALIRAWTTERGTPTIQPWRPDLLEDVLHKLSQQNAMLELLRGDPKTSEEEHFKLIVVQTEMERVRFAVRGYLRCRLAKVEKYAQWITTTPEAQRLLSQLELSHAEKYTKLLHTHYQESVLQSLPEKLRGLDVDFGTQRSMIRKPDKTTPVLIYVKRDLPDLVLSTGERAGLSARSMHLVRYSLVERYIEEGSVEVF